MIRLLRPRPLLIGWPEAVLAKNDTAREPVTVEPSPPERAPPDPFSEAGRTLSAKAHKPARDRERATHQALWRECAA